MSETNSTVSAAFGSLYPNSRLSFLTRNPEHDMVWKGNGDFLKGILSVTTMAIHDRLW